MKNSKKVVLRLAGLLLAAVSLWVCMPLITNLPSSIRESQQWIAGFILMGGLQLLTGLLVFTFAERIYSNVLLKCVVFWAVIFLLFAVPSLVSDWDNGPFGMDISLGMLLGFPWSVSVPVMIWGFETTPPKALIDLINTGALFLNGVAFGLLMGALAMLLEKRRDNNKLVPTASPQHS